MDKYVKYGQIFASIASSDQVWQNKIHYIKYRQTWFNMACICSVIANYN